MFAPFLFLLNLSKTISLFLEQILIGKFASFYKLFISALFLLVLSLQCNLCSQDISIQAREKIDLLARQIVSKMTDEEKAGQVIHVTLPGKKISEEAIKEISKIKPGGIILFGVNLENKKQISRFTSEIQSEAEKQKLLPLFISTDQEGGRVIRVQKGVTQFPGAMAVGQTGKEDYAYKVGFITSYQLNRIGINVVFAPSLDINNNPKNPVINTRSFGSDLETVSTLGTAYELGARKGGALPVIKHFPGHGDTNVDSHLGLPVIEKTIEEISEFEIIPFRRAIQNGAKAVMSAHIVYPKIEKDYPATLSPKILREILRNRLQFSGLVFSDAMEMDAISKNYKNVERGILAIQAGVDVILMTSYGKNTLEYYEMVLDGIKSKKFLTKEGVDLLDEAIVRQVKLKIEQGLFHIENPIFKIEDPIINQYIEETRKKREAEFTKLEEAGFDALNSEISMASIRSFREEFTPVSEENKKDYYFIIRNKKLKKIIKDHGLNLISEKGLGKSLKKNHKMKIVMDSNDAKDIEKISNLLKKSKYSEIILYHSGSPFLDFSKIKNAKILFSFSPTKPSLEALFKKSMEGTEVIPKAELIFTDSPPPSKKETKPDKS